MAFESLSEKFQSIFKNLRGKGRLTEADVTAAMREVKMALLEADVNFKVVKDFVAAVKERAVGEEVMASLSPGQQVIKIVNEEMTKLMQSENSGLTFAKEAPTIFMMVGLQGNGKTTSTAKLAGLLKKQGKKPLLVACDVYRPAAVKQLQVVGAQQKVDVFEMGTEADPVEIAAAALEHAKKNRYDVMIVDTAGRLHIDEEMMQELVRIKEKLNPQEILLTIDAMAGQDAVNVAERFHQLLDITGVILTKMDGDTRGGAALSVKAVTQRPIKFVGVGEKLSDLEVFHADRMASRILGMGDILTLIEKASAHVDEEKAKEMERKLRKAEFNFEDFLDQMKQMRNMGPLTDLLAMLPGVAGQLKDIEIDESGISRMEAIILSMTPEERRDPSLLNPSRKHRIAKGSGNQIQEVNRFIKQFEESKKMMKQMSGMMKGGKKKKGMFNMPFFK